jgi:hypothetical protein
MIEINIAAQRLRLTDGVHVLLEYPVSTALNGVGERNGSECTPRGRHTICAKIGAGAAENTVFVARRDRGALHTGVCETPSGARLDIDARIVVERNRARSELRRRRRYASTLYIHSWRSGHGTDGYGGFARLYTHA